MAEEQFMYFDELSRTLDELKGEESVFKLFEQEKNTMMHQTLSSISELFLATELEPIKKLDESFAAIRKNPSKVLSVTGEKGVGKSTVVSLLATNHFLEGNLDELEYYRYDLNSKNFRLLFETRRPEIASRAVVLDDLHYFLPDMLTGKLAPYVRVLESITAEYKKLPIKTKLPVVVAFR